MEWGLREGWQEEEITFLECLVCVRVRRAQCWGAGYRPSGDCGVCGGRWGGGTWSPGDPIPDRSQARVQGLGAIAREKGPEGKTGSGT